MDWATLYDGSAILLTGRPAIDKDGTVLRRPITSFQTALALAIGIGFAPALLAQQPRPQSFRAEHYEVSASLNETAQALSATARVSFVATEAARVVEVELHPNLNVAGVTGSDGKPLPTERDTQNPLILRTTLPSLVGAGGHVTLTYAYSGIMANEDNSP